MRADGPTGAVAWWRDESTLARYLGDLLAAEVAALRPGRCLPAHPAPAEDLVTCLGLDSLEWLAMSTALLQAVPDDGAAPLEPPRRWGAWLDLVRAGLERGAAVQSFRSSGSTGVPRLHRHALTDLCEEMGCMARVIGARRRVVSLVPGHHIYGFLFSILLPHMLGGVPVLAVPIGQAASLPGRLQPGDLVVGFPEAWAALLPQVARWPADVVGVSSTAPLPDPVAEALRAAGLTRLLQVYGSSETAGIGWRDDPGAPYALHPYWRADPHDPQRLWRWRDGQPVAAHGLPDVVGWEGERHLRPVGRVDGSVQIGGVNVQPDEVARALRAQPFVAEAVVRPLPLATGLRLKAFVVPTDDAPADLDARLMGWASRALAPVARPVSLRLGAQLPRGALGKLADWPA